MAQLIRLSMLFVAIVGLLASMAKVDAAECPQDPLACLVVQMLNAKNDRRKLDIEESNGHDDRDMIVDPTASAAVDGQPDQAINEAKLGSGSMSKPHHHHGHHSKANVTYCSNDHPTGQNCSKCTVCPKKALLLRACNQSHDSVCVCQDGTYFSALTYECRPCDQCTAGYGVWRHCTRNRNTVCRECPPGTYSGVVSGKLGCLLCSSCRPDQVMLQECSTKQDTVCIDKNISQKRYFSKSDDHVQSLHVQSSALPIYFTILVVLICGLVIYVIMQCRIKNMVKPPLPLTRNHIVYMPTTVAARHTKKPTSSSNYVPLATNKPSATPTRSSWTPLSKPTVAQQPKNIVLNMTNGQVISKVHPGRLVRSGSKNRSTRSSSRKSSSSRSVRRSESVKATNRPLMDSSSAPRAAEV